MSIFALSMQKKDSMETPPLLPPSSQNNPPPPFIPPSPVSVVPPKGNDKLWCILSHLSLLLGVGIILPLIVYLVMRDESKYVADNAREALNYHISLYLWFLCCIPFMFLCYVGLLMWMLLGLEALIFAIIASVKAADGGCIRYPMTLRLIK